jgi:acetyl-CoA carboxylase/biotin carboxylase 1
MFLSILVFKSGVNKLQEPTSTDEIGTNTVGIVVWRMTMHTPEYPEGRPAIVIANDITLQNGSMCNKEDLVFLKGKDFPYSRWPSPSLPIVIIPTVVASELARKEGIPRIYISANSGARIGLADEVKAKFQISWKGKGNNRSLNYLYLLPEDFKELNGVTLPPSPPCPFFNVCPSSNAPRRRRKW